MRPSIKYHRHCEACLQAVAISCNYHRKHLNDRRFPRPPSGLGMTELMVRCKDKQSFIICRPVRESICISPLAKLGSCHHPAGGKQQILLRYPASSSVTVHLPHLPTAATRSPPCFRPRRRSDRSPNLNWPPGSMKSLISWKPFDLTIESPFGRRMRSPVSRTTQIQKEARPDGRASFWSC